MYRKEKEKRMKNFRRMNMKVAPPLCSNLIPICCLVCLSNLLFFASCLTSPSPPPSGVVSLYNSSSDFVVSLDSSSIDSVFQRDSAFILELYSSRCGHCIHFAPYYKAVAKFTRFWRPVIVVAAINCADSRNLDTCRRFNIYGFPTLRLIPANAPPTHRGFEVDVRYVTNENMAHALVEKMLGFVAMHGGEDRPEHWPHPPSRLDDVYDDESVARRKIQSLLDSYSDSESIIGSATNEEEEEIVLVFENATSNSFIARTVALDLSSKMGVKIPVFAVAFSEESRQTAYGKFNFNNDNDTSENNLNDTQTGELSNPTGIYPTMITTSMNITSSSLSASLFELTSIPSIVFVSSSNVSLARAISYAEWESERESLFEIQNFEFIYDDRLDNNNNNSNSDHNDTKGVEIKVGSFSPDDDLEHSLPDLDNMLRISLLEEIGSRQSLTLEQLKAATSYVRVLSKYFQGSPRTKLYLDRLHSRLSATTRASSPASSLPIRQWFKLLQSSNESNGILPPKRPWNRCKGSAPKYRGYPCAVWTTFHAMSVAAALTHDERLAAVRVEGDDRNYPTNGTEVLDAMIGFMHHFFGCRHCARHFGEMVANSTDEVSTYDDVVLWLWEAHNRVNRRLKGDASEDPLAPKIQFPDAKMCAECQEGGVEEDRDGKAWRRSRVLGFLKEYFSPSTLKIADAVIFEESALKAAATYFPTSPLSPNCNSRLESRVSIYLLIFIWFIRGWLVPFACQLVRQ